MGFMGNTMAQSETPVDPTIGQVAPGTHARVATSSRAAPATGLVDDFNRADGAIGGDWTVHSGSCSIVSNAARCGSTGLATNSVADGATTLSMDVQVGSGGLQYAGLVQGYGGGGANIFIKVQSNSGGAFDYFACYTGNNGGSFGAGFTPLDATFTSATMTIERVGSDVTIYFTNIDGGSQSDQTYVCSGAPTPDGTGAGIAGYASLAIIDNFGSGNATPASHEVTTAVSSGNGSIGPASQTVSGGGTATGTVSADTGWSLDSLAGDTCSPVDNGDGTWSAANITADCAITATFTLNSYEVTASVSEGNGSIGPASQMVDHDGTASGTVTADPGWFLNSLTGDSCSPVDNGDGTWSAMNITESCTVAATFTMESYLVPVNHPAALIMLVLLMLLVGWLAHHRLLH